MAVDLKRLPAHEEAVRHVGLGNSGSDGEAIQNVLDALNYYRCKANFAEQELARARYLAARDRYPFKSLSD